MAEVVKEEGKAVALHPVAHREEGPHRHTVSRPHRMPAAGQSAAVASSLATLVEDTLVVSLDKSLRSSAFH